MSKIFLLFIICQHNIQSMEITFVQTSEEKQNIEKQTLQLKMTDYFSMLINIPTPYVNILVQQTQNMPYSHNLNLINVVDIIIMNTIFDIIIEQKEKGNLSENSVKYDIDTIKTTCKMVRLEMINTLTHQELKLLDTTKQLKDLCEDIPEQFINTLSKKKQEVIKYKY